MNLVLLFPEDFIEPGVVRLTDYRAEHIREIHRAAVGKTLKVGLAGGGIGDGTVVSIEKTGVELQVTIPESRPEVPRTSLILAMPRPQTLKKVLETIGAFGLHRLVLINTDRVQKSFFGSKLLKDQAWMKHLRLGMEQGSRTYLPTIDVEPSLGRFLPKIESAFPEAIRIIAHPGGNQSLWDTPLVKGGEKEIVGAIGPEGGWLDAEVDAFLSLGFAHISLGATVHRVENAVTALLAQLELIRLGTAQAIPKSDSPV